MFYSGILGELWEIFFGRDLGGLGGLGENRWLAGESDFLEELDLGSAPG